MYLVNIARMILARGESLKAGAGRVLIHPRPDSRVSLRHWRLSEGAGQLPVRVTVTVLTKLAPTASVRQRQSSPLKVGQCRGRLGRAVKKGAIEHASLTGLLCEPC
jgi:hypothetical protein